MKRAPVTLHDQIDIVEKRVRLEKLQLSAAIQGLRTSVRNIVSGPGGVAIFLVAAGVGIFGGRKLTSRRRTLPD